jgi:hypothetical protein
MRYPFHSECQNAREGERTAGDCQFHDIYPKIGNITFNSYSMETVWLVLLTLDDNH